MASPPVEWLSRPAEIREPESMRTSENHCELHVDEHHVDILLAPHIDVDRQAAALALCLDALAEPEDETWSRSRDGLVWGLAWNLDTDFACSLVDRYAWWAIEREHRRG